MFSDNSESKSSTPRAFLPALAKRLPLLIPGLLVIVYSFFDPRFRGAAGELTGSVCLPVSIGAAVLILGWTVKSRWQKAGLWLALAVTGQAIALQLVNAGAGLRYQHYKSLSEIFSGHPLLAGFLMFQTAVVSVGLWYRRKIISDWLKNNLRIWQLLIVGAVFLVPTATVSENVSFYVREWLFAGFIQTINLGAVILFALSIPAGALERSRRFLERVSGGRSAGESAAPGRLNGFAPGLAVFVAVSAALLNVFSYERHPHVPDEVAYLTHARFFAAAAVKLPAPPVPEAFEVYLMKLDGDRWYPAPPPGWPMILAIGALLGLAWLVNPLLAGLNLVLAYKLTGELYGERTARLTAFLLACSPWYVFLGMSFMTHMAALTFALLAALFTNRARRTGKSVWGWAAGFALGFIFLVRPLEAVAMAGLLGLWAIGIGGKRLKIPATAGLVLGSMVVGGLGLVYNAHLTGNPLEFPINAYTNERFGPESNAYGFGPNRGMGWAIDPNPGHGPVDALINSNLNTSTMNTELFGWSIGSFLFIAAFFCFAGRFRQSDYLMLAVIFVIYWLHFFYYFSGGPDFAARYWFLMIVPLVVLSARGVRLTAEKLDKAFAGAGARVYILVVTLCLLALVNFIPWRAVDKYHNFRGMRPDVRQLSDAYDFGRSLVLVEGNQHPEYDSAFIYNPLDFRADAPIYAWNRDGETRRKLLEAYPDRPVWIIKSPSLTGRGFEVAAGPLSARDLLENSQPQP